MTDKTGKPHNKIVAIRTKDGADLLGFYCGESDKTELFEHSITLFKPIYISPMTSKIGNTTLHTYSASLYFRYGSGVVHMPYSHIRHHDLASPFFTKFYFENIGDVVAYEDNINTSHVKFYERRDIKEAMRGTDSILVESMSQYIQ